MALDANGFVRRDPQGRAQDVARCRLCDDDGYRGGMVCDHEDHTAAARRGMDMVREAMGWQQ